MRTSGSTIAMQQHHASCIIHHHAPYPLSVSGSSQVHRTRYGIHRSTERCRFQVPFHMSALTLHTRPHTIPDLVRVLLSDIKYSSRHRMAAGLFYLVGCIRTSLHTVFRMEFIQDSLHCRLVRAARIHLHQVYFLITTCKVTPLVCIEISLRENDAVRQAVRSCCVPLGESRLPIIQSCVCLQRCGVEVADTSGKFQSMQWFFPVPTSVEPSCRNAEVVIVALPIENPNQKARSSAQESLIIIL